MSSPLSQASVPHAQAGARTALVLLLTINLFNFLDRQVLAAVESHIERDYFPESNQTNAGWMGSLNSAFMFSYMLFAPLFGWLADRMKRWLLVGIGVTLWSLASGATGLAPTFAVLLGATGFGAFAILFLTRCFVGIGEAAYGPVAPTVISDMYPVQQRGQKLAWFYVAIPVGSALGYVLGGAVATLTGDWRWSFFSVVPPGIALGIWCFFMPDPPRGQADAGVVVKKPKLSDYLLILRTPSYLLDTLGMTAMTFAFGAIAFFFPRYIVERYQTQFGEGDYLATVNLIMGAIAAVSGMGATLLGGMAGDRLRPHIGSAYFLVSGLAMIVGFPMVLLVLYVPFPLAWVFVFLACFCLFFNTGPTNTILANVTHPSVRASAFALNILIIHALGDAISPMIVGFVRDKTSWNMALSIVSGMFLVAAALWLWGCRFVERDTALALAGPAQETSTAIVPSAVVTGIQPHLPAEE